MIAGCWGESTPASAGAGSQTKPGDHPPPASSQLYHSPYQWQSEGICWYDTRDRHRRLFISVADTYPRYVAV